MTVREVSRDLFQINRTFKTSLCGSAKPDIFITAVIDAVRHPIKALKVGALGVRTDGPMAPEISLSSQRPAEFTFSSNVERELAKIRVTERRTEPSTSA